MLHQSKEVLQVFLVAGPTHSMWGPLSPYDQSNPVTPTAHLPDSQVSHDLHAYVGPWLVGLVTVDTND